MEGKVNLSHTKLRNMNKYFLGEEGGGEKETIWELLALM